MPESGMTKAELTLKLQ